MVTLFSEIFESKSQGPLLAFLLVAPTRSFTAKELSARLKITTPAVSSALSVLEKNNLVRTFSKHGVRFYLLNLKHASVPIMRTEMLKTQKPWHDELLVSLNKVGSLAGVFLSGVFVGRSGAPIDLLLVGKVQQPKLEKFLSSCNKLYGGELDYSIMSEDEFKIRRDTFDRFLKDIFDYPHLALLDKTISKSKSTKSKSSVGGKK